MDDLRWDPRVTVSLPVELVRIRRIVEATVRDVSYGGLFIETGEALRPFSLVRLKIQLPYQLIQVHGVVAHAELDGAGLHFFGLAGPDRIAWNDYVRDRLMEARAA